LCRLVNIITDNGSNRDEDDHTWYRLFWIVIEKIGIRQERACNRKQNQPDWNFDSKKMTGENCRNIHTDIKKHKFFSIKPHFLFGFSSSFNKSFIASKIIANFLSYFFSIFSTFSLNSLCVAKTFLKLINVRIYECLLYSPLTI